MARHDEREAVPLGSSLAAFFAIWRRCRRACPDVPEGLAQAEAAEGRGHQYWQLERRRHWQDAHRSEEHTSELQSRLHLVCRLLLEKKKRSMRQQRTLLTHLWTH